MRRFVGPALLAIALGLLARGAEGGGAAYGSPFAGASSQVGGARYGSPFATSQPVPAGPPMWKQTSEGWVRHPAHRHFGQQSAVPPAISPGYPHWAWVEPMWQWTGSRWVWIPGYWVPAR